MKTKIRKRHQSADHVIPHLAVTPLGDELVMGPECEEPTRVIRVEHLRHLLGASNPHTHQTVSMKAVKA